jgi:DnaK suppressor protein
MEANRIADIRTVIEQRLADLQRTLRACDGQDDERLQQLHDEATRFDTLAHLSVDAALCARAREDQARLQRQLLRLEEEDFGICHECGDPIAPNRIVSVPATELCITCAQQQENGQ